MPAPTRDRLARRVDISSLYPGAARIVNLIVDEPGLLWSGLSSFPSPTMPSTHVGSGHRFIGSRRSGSGSFPRVNSENRTVMRSRGSPLPYWYPRTPLRDITHVVRVAAVSEQGTLALDSAIIRIDKELGVSTPVRFKPHISPAVRIDDENKPDQEFMTPQKRLLESIEKVRSVVGGEAETREDPVC